MGRRGPAAKPAEIAQGRRRRQIIRVEPPERHGPPPVEEWREGVKVRWEVYWASSVASVATDADQDLVYRLFELYNELAGAREVVRKILVVKGSTGQIRVNPVAAHANQLEAIILRLEIELGKTPMARARLGLAVGQLQLTAAEINDMVRPSDGGGGAPEFEVIEGFTPG